MGNPDNMRAAVAKSVDGEGIKKITFRFDINLITKCVVCVLMGFATVFADMAPFSLALYAALFSVDGWVWLFVACAVGMFASNGVAGWVYVASMAMITVVFAVMERKDSLIKRCIVSCVLFSVFKITRLCVGQVTAYDFMAVALENMILFLGVVVAHYGYPLFTGAAKRSFISSAEKLCAFAFAAFVILALGNIEIYQRINLSSVASVLCICVMCSGAGIENATVFGTIAGVVTAMSTHPSVDVAGVYAFGALMASVFSRHGKVGVVFGFVLASTGFSLLVSDNARIYSGIAESLMASLVYVMLPEKAILGFSSLFAKCAGGYHPYAEVQNDAKERLDPMKKMAVSFRELSGIYLDCAKDKSIGRAYMISKVNHVSKKVCTFCPSHNKCFDTTTQRGAQRALQLFENSVKNGKLDISLLPSPMKEICHRKDSFADAFNSMLDALHTENMWLGKINESRRLIGDQLSAVADSIEKICKGDGLHFNPSLSEALRAELDKNGIYTFEVRAHSDSKGDFNIYVSFREGYLPSDAAGEISKCIDRIAYAKSRFVSSEVDGGIKTLLFCPRRKYTASFGYASKAKYGQSVSGDSFKIITPDKKSVVMALSDGMGYGETAKNESRTAISLLEKFLVAGFDSDTAVRLINSSLLLKSSRDSFATVDICSIDLSDHTIVFTKLGAANTYIRTSDGVELIRGRNLPAGILKEIEIENHMLPVAEDTVIVMISDGVGDTGIKSKKYDGWIEKALMKLDTRNPQIIAAKILEYAYMIDGKQPNDDMTVLVGCILSEE